MRGLVGFLPLPAETIYAWQTRTAPQSYPQGEANYRVRIAGREGWISTPSGVSSNERWGDTVRIFRKARQAFFLKSRCSR